MQHSTSPSRRSEQGQILVIFALSITVIIAMAGLILDGSGAYSQRRSEQNAADLAALAGANAYMNTTGAREAKRAAAITAAQASAGRNTIGITNAAVTVDVTYASSGGVVIVGLTGAHPNAFARIVPGQDSWNVSVTALAWAGIIDTGVGAAPWTMDIDAFNLDGTPKYTASNPQNFGSSCGDYPVDALDLSWTTSTALTTSTAPGKASRRSGTNMVTSTIGFEQYLGQHNQGCHTTLFGDVNAALAGKKRPGSHPWRSGASGHDLRHVELCPRLLQRLGHVPRDRPLRRKLTGHPSLFLESFEPGRSPSASALPRKRPPERVTRS